MSHVGPAGLSGPGNCLWGASCWSASAGLLGRPWALLGRPLDSNLRGGGLQDRDRWRGVVQCELALLTDETARLFSGSWAGAKATSRQCGMDNRADRRRRGRAENLERDEWWCTDGLGPMPGCTAHLWLGGCIVMRTGFRSPSSVHQPTQMARTVLLESATRIPRNFALPRSTAAAARR